MLVFKVGSAEKWENGTDVVLYKVNHRDQRLDARHVYFGLEALLLIPNVS